MHLKIRKFWILPWWSPVKPTDNVWNAGVVTDCWRFLSLVSICQLLLQSTQHERTFYNQFSLVCNQKKKFIYNNIVQSYCEFFFQPFWKQVGSVLRLTLDVIRQREKISVIRYFWCPFCFALSLVSHVLWGVISPALSTKNPRLVWPRHKDYMAIPVGSLSD